MFRDYWFGGFEESTFKIGDGEEEEHREDAKELDGLFPNEPTDTCTTA